MNFEILYPNEVENARKKEAATLIDIRSREAYERDHWTGAINLPEDEVADYTKILYRGRGYIFYCQHGGSSMQLARSLGKQGFRTATVVGGFDAMKKIQNRR